MPAALDCAELHWEAVVFVGKFKQRYFEIEEWIFLELFVQILNFSHQQRYALGGGMQKQNEANKKKIMKFSKFKWEAYRAQTTIINSE